MVISLLRFEELGLQAAEDLGNGLTGEDQLLNKIVNSV